MEAVHQLMLAAALLPYSCPLSFTVLAFWRKCYREMEMLLHFVMFFHAVVSQFLIHTCLLFFTCVFSSRFLISVLHYRLPATQEKLIRCYLLCFIFLLFAGYVFIFHGLSLSQ